MGWMAGLLGINIDGNILISQSVSIRVLDIWHQRFCVHFEKNYIQAAFHVLLIINSVLKFWLHSCISVDTVPRMHPS